MRRWAGIVAVAVGVVALSACGADTGGTASGAAPATSATSAPGATTGGAPGTTVAVQKDLLASEVDPPGGEGSTLTLMRYTIAPGAKLSPHIHPGVQLARIESGTLTYTVVEGTISVTRADGTVEPLTAPATTTLEVGDAVAENDGMVHYGANETDEPVVIIASLLTKDGEDLAVPVTTVAPGLIRPVGSSTRSVGNPASMVGVLEATIDGGGPMMSSRRRCALVVTVVAAVVLVAGACGSSSTETGSPGGAGTSAPASTTTTTEAPPGTATSDGTVDLVVISTPYGDAIGTDDGLVLYTWDTEADGTIACVDAACLEKWPPLLADEIGDVGGIDPTSLTLVERPDGSDQIAIDGRPLYHMAVDEPGEATCQGAEGWWIVNPDGTKNTTETPRSTSTTVSNDPGY